jgi:hypothetical protein
MNILDVQKIIKDKIIGVWIPEHDDKGHHYRNTIDNRLVDSVTTQNIIDKPHLIKWAARIGVEYFIDRMQLYCKETHEQLVKDSSLAYTGIRDDAGFVGNEIHDVVENYINYWIETDKRDLDIITFIPSWSDPRVYAGARSAEKLFDKHPNVKPIASELLVGSTDKKIDAAGTLDFLVWVWDESIYNGWIELWDWKSSNSAVHDDYAIQVATYKAFFEQMSGLKIKRCTIIGLSKMFDNYKMYDVPYTNRAYSVFKNNHKTYLWLKKDTSPKLIERKNRLIIK